jgi:hypothetical protein
VGGRARAACETQHRTGGRCTRNQGTTAQHKTEFEPARFPNQEKRDAVSACLNAELRFSGSC